MNTEMQISRDANKIILCWALGWTDDNELLY